MRDSRRKPVSAEEEALFKNALKDARPLKKRPRAAAPPHPRVRIFVPLPHYPREPTYTEDKAPAIGGHAAAHYGAGGSNPMRGSICTGSPMTAPIARCCVVS